MKKALPVIIFWGLWIILMWWLINRNEDKSYLTDPYLPDEGADVHIYR